MDRIGFNENYGSTAPVSAVLGRIDRKQMAAVVRAVVRGTRPVADLATVGLSPSDAEQFAGIRISSADFAEAMLSLKSDPAALDGWARFVLRNAEAFDYAGDDVPCCRQLLSYIWQISFGNGLTPRAITMATMVRNWPRRAA